MDASFAFGAAASPDMIRTLETLYAAAADGDGTGEEIGADVCSRPFAAANEFERLWEGRRENAELAGAPIRGRHIGDAQIVSRSWTSMMAGRSPRMELV